MKLDNIRNIKIWQKSLYSEQLVCYSHLCELYYELAELSKDNVSPEKIQSLYAKPLTLASKNDRDFSKIGNFSEKEIIIFNKYADYSQKLNDLSTASKLLSEVIINE